MKKTKSAGGVVVNEKGEVLIVNQNGDSWSLPKGHIDPGETAIEAARREIGDERDHDVFVSGGERGRRLEAGGSGESRGEMGDKRRSFKIIDPLQRQGIFPKNCV